MLFASLCETVAGFWKGQNCVWLDNAKHTVLLIGTKNNGEMLRERKYEKPGHRLSAVSGESDFIEKFDIAPAWCKR